VKFGRGLLLALLGLALLVLGAARLELLAGRPPADLGVRNGRLQAPSLTPNSVSSQSRLHPGHPQQAAAQIDPLPLRAGDGAASMQALAAVLRDWPGMTVVTQQPDYLYARARTPWLHFVDDLEFWFDPAAGAIELRSASRLGSRDFGVNRQRIEAIRARYLAQP
jgi:uncharacterized protein (DUF1499 family)